MSEHAQHDDDAVVVERFRPTSGRFSGLLGLGTAGLVLVLALVGGSREAFVVAVGAALGGVLVWAALLRPALWATRRDLVMRGMFHTDRLPLAAIDRVRVSQVLTVVAGDRRMVSPVVGYTLRQTVKTRARSGGIEQPNLGGLEPPPVAADGARAVAGEHQAFVESRIEHLATTARDLAGIRPGSAEQRALADDVRRTWAWPEIGAVVVLGVLLVTLLLR